MTWDLCSSQAAIAKAGLNANSTIIASGATLGLWSDQTQGSINAETRRDWVGSSANAQTSGALQEAASSLIANKIIAYDMGSIGRSEALSRINTNRDLARINIGYLDNEEHKEKM